LLRGIFFRAKQERESETGMQRTQLYPSLFFVPTTLREMLRFHEHAFHDPIKPRFYRKDTKSAKKPLTSTFASFALFAVICSRPAAGQIKLNKTEFLGLIPDLISPNRELKPVKIRQRKFTGHSTMVSRYSASHHR
jgi:hypothetical protein